MVNSGLCAFVCIASPGQTARFLPKLERSLPRDRRNAIGPTYTFDYASLCPLFDCVNIMAKLYTTIKLCFPRIIIMLILCRTTFIMSSTDQ